jgi:hypothetical protein
MKVCKYLFILPLTLIIVVSACASKVPHSVKNDYENVTAKVIAVLPVDNRSKDSRAPHLLRLKILEELYFKGYTKLSLDVIDKKLEPLYISDNKSRTGLIAPAVVKELVGADAVMYCAVTEGSRTVNLFYAPVTMAAQCELRSTQTGEVLWNSQYRSTSRSFDFTRKRLELKSYEAFETLIEEVVNKVMETLPDGPNLRG